MKTVSRIETTELEGQLLNQPTTKALVVFKDKKNVKNTLGSIEEGLTDQFWDEKR